MRFAPFLPLFALPLLAACAPQMETTLRVSDIVKVGRDGGTLEIPAVLRIPQSGQDPCKEGLPNLTKALADLMPVTDTGTCIDQNGDSYAEVGTTLTLFAEGDAAPVSTLLAVEIASNIHAVAAGFYLKLYMARTVEEISTVVKAASSEFGVAEFDEPPKFVVWLANDAGETIDVIGHQVFVDGNPAFEDIEGTDITVAQGAQAELVLSDVASAYLATAHAYTFATVVTDQQ